MLLCTCMYGHGNEHTITEIGSNNANLLNKNVLTTTVL